MTDTTYNPKVYRKQGGDELVVASGGKISVETGGTIEVNGDDLIAEVAALSGLDSGELGVLNGVVAGTVTASKALVVGADKNVDTLAIAASGLKIGAGAGTAVTTTAAELNVNAGVVAGTSTASKTAVLGADKNLDILALPVSGLKIGAGAGTAVDRTAAELNLLAQGVAAGYKVARVEMALDGSNPSSWTHGLATVIAAGCSLKGSAAPGVGTCLVTAVINGAAIDFYAWKPTGAGDCTLIASTGTESIYAWAIGT